MLTQRLGHEYITAKEKAYLNADANEALESAYWQTH